MTTEDLKTEIEAPTSRAPEPKPDARRRKLRKIGGLIAGAAALGSVLAGLAGYWTTYRTVTREILAPAKPAPTEAAHLSIVVLPFTNLSGDPSQDYFADGITDNLTTDLSRIRNSFVIARNTAFTYKGKSIDAKGIGKELGVRYVLEGSVQREQHRVRVNVQLIDAESGVHLWADRFDEDIADLFKLQDEVVGRLGNALGAWELVKAEGERGARSKSPDAIDLTMRGLALFSQGAQQPMKEKHESYNTARTLCEQALKLDPNEPYALVCDGFTYLADYLYAWGSSETDYEAKVLGQADRAIALDRNFVGAYWLKSLYLGVSHRAPEALGVANAGLAINPNFAMLYQPRANAEICLGRFEEAKTDLQQAMRLSPRDQDIGVWQIQLGQAEIGTGHIAAAIEEYQKAFNRGSRGFWTYSNLAAAYALDGRMDEAKPYLAEARRLNPNLTVKWYREHACDIPPLFEGLRKAGLPEE